MNKPVTFKQILRRYRSNEAKNYHNENALLLAKCFGTAEEVAAIEQIIREYEQSGDGLTMEQSRRRHEIANKYYTSLVKAGAMVQECFRTTTQPFPPT